MCSAISSYRSACSASFAKYTFCSRASTIVQKQLLRARNLKPAKGVSYTPSLSTHTSQFQYAHQLSCSRDGARVAVSATAIMLRTMHRTVPALRANRQRRTLLLTCKPRSRAHQLNKHNFNLVGCVPMLHPPEKPPPPSSTSKSGFALMPHYAPRHTRSGIRVFHAPPNEHP